MKKSIFILLFVLSAVTFCFGQESSEILTADVQNVELYASVLEEANNVGKAIFLNLLPGFGTGSYVQGDSFGGIMGTTFSVVTATGLVGLGGTFAMDVFVSFFAGIGGQKAVDQATAQLTPWLWGFGITAGVGLLANIVWGIIRPLNYRDSVNASYGNTVAVLPVVTPNAVGLSAVVRY